jgi:hypothetical protein
MALFTFVTLWGLILYWIGLSILVFIVPYLVSRQGSFVVDMQNTAYGMVPYFIFIMTDRLRQPISPVHAGIASFSTRGLFEAGTSIMYFIAVVWSGYLLAIAISKNHQLSMVQACFVVGAIVALIFSWNVDMVSTILSQWI